MEQWERMGEFLCIWNGLQTGRATFGDRFCLSQLEWAMSFLLPFGSRLLPPFRPSARSLILSESNQHLRYPPDCFFDTRNVFHL